MASLVERNEENRFVKAQKRKTAAKRIIIGICAAAIIGVIAYGVNSYVNKVFNTYEIVKTIPREDSNTVKYISSGSNIIKYSRDGAACYNANGEVLWNGSYDFKNPAIDICETYTAIADIGGKEAIVFNGNDSGTTITTLLPIVQVQVANQGVTALVLEDKTSNVIHIYAPNSVGMELKVEVPTNVQKDGFPVDIALSNDGRRMVSAYMNINNGVMENTVTFYNFGEVGQAMMNQVTGARSFENNVVAKVDFLNMNTICVYGERSFTLYSMEEKPEDIKQTITFEKNIRSTFSNSNYVGFVLENYEGNEKYQVVVYDVRANKVLDKTMNYDYETVFLSGKEIVFYRELECHILKLNGVEKLNYIFDKNIEYFMPINNYDKYFLIDNTEIQIIKLTEEK